MRKHFLCSVAAIPIITAVSSPVAAADLKTPLLHVPTWAGFYLGGHRGYGRAKFRGLADSGGDQIVPDGPRVSGYTLGLHTGFNWQAGQWLYGIEGDVTATPGWQKRLCGVFSNCDSNNHVYGQLDALASIRARLGMTFDRTLIYATGGAAFAKRRIEVGSNAIVEHYGIKAGGVVGGGIEWKYNPNLSLRLEGLHYIFNEKRNEAIRGGFQAEQGIKNATVIRVGASWHPEGGFWGKGPVAAADPAMRGKAPLLHVPTWAGFYLGGHAGYGWAKFNGLADSGGSQIVPNGPRVSGFALGLHTGFNWQAGQWLYGIEGDVTATPGWQKRLCGVFSNCDSNNHVYGQLDALASIRARLGMSFDRTLVYATGGVAFAKRRIEVGSDEIVEHYGIKTGGVFGGGIEWKYNPNLSLRVEGLHYIFNEKRNEAIRGGFQAEQGIKNATVIRVGASWHPEGGFWGKGPVAAADAAMRGKAPAPALYVPTWTGFYLGGHMGYGSGKFRGLAAENNSQTIDEDFKVSGFALGFHTGYNWQAGQWVYGIEGDVTATPGWQKRICSVFSNCDSNNHVYGQLDALASIRARLGMTFDRTLIYATGGVAFAKRRIEVGSNEIVEHYGTKTGGVFGGGIEWKYNPNLSLRLEGLHYIFNEKRNEAIDGGFQAEQGIKNATVIRIGASWHPEGGLWGKGPVVSRY